jgi:hypothetical protein
LEGLEDVKVKPTVENTVFSIAKKFKTCGVVELKLVYKNKTYMKILMLWSSPKKEYID